MTHSPCAATHLSCGNGRIAGMGNATDFVIVATENDARYVKYDHPEFRDHVVLVPGTHESVLKIRGRIVGEVVLSFGAADNPHCSRLVAELDRRRAARNG